MAPSVTLFDLSAYECVKGKALRHHQSECTAGVFYEGVVPAHAMPLCSWAEGPSSSDCYQSGHAKGRTLACSSAHML